MRLIELKYHRPILGATTYSVPVPTSWEELTPEQLLRVGHLLYARKLDIYRFRVELLRILVQLKWHHLMMLGGAYLVELFPFVSFIEENIDLRTQKIPEIKIGLTRYFGPIGDFATLRAEEWTACDEAFLDFKESQDPTHLDKLVAILFRRRQKGMWTGHSQWAGDYREPYREHTVARRQEAFQKIDQRIRYATLIWWIGCRLEWEELFERVFKSKSEGPESFGWEETLMKLSGAEFGTDSETRSTHMYKLMLKMESSLKDDEYRREQERLTRRKHAH